MSMIQRLKQERIEHPLKKKFKGYTYSQIAAAIGVHPMTVSNAFNGWGVSEETEFKLQQLAAELKKERVNVR
jgi:transcriptional regulator with XRE-family HTH domain